jgi:hypothetical protein
MGGEIGTKDFEHHAESSNDFEMLWTVLEWQTGLATAS